MTATPTEGPLSVACPDCTAPAGVECLHSNTSPVDGPHPSRERFARLRAVEHGTCALCHRGLVRGHHDTEGPDTVWHPDPTDAAACPQLPDPALDWNAYAAAVNDGVRPGFPGPAAFVLTDPTPPPAPVCPDCRDSKHAVCQGTAWSETEDGPVDCACSCRPHPCGHHERTTGCGGCDPAAIDVVITDEGVTRPYDPDRDLRPACPIHLGQVCVCDVEGDTQ